jgi:hypothetical protein
MNPLHRIGLATALLVFVHIASASELTLPVPLTLNFVLRYGELTVGTVTKTLEREADGRYRHHSLSVPKGMARWFTEVEWNEDGRLEVVNGTVRPLRFLEYRVGADKPHRHEAIFDWSAGKIRYASGVVMNLPTGTQDQGSLLFAFMLHPPIAGKSQTLHISSGKKLRQYEYSDAGQERLKTAIGPIQTRIIDRVVRKSGDEAFRIWLATGYQNNRSGAGIRSGSADIWGTKTLGLCRRKFHNLLISNDYRYVPGSCFESRPHIYRLAVE